MKTIALVFCLFVAANMTAQKLGNIKENVSALEMNQVATRFNNQVEQLNKYEPIGIHQYRDNDANFKPIYFEVYPHTASTWLGCDFPTKRNVQFIRIVNVAGQVVGVYHPWDRMFYVGSLPSGLYQLQIVQRNYYAHTTTFFKR